MFFETHAHYDDKKFDADRAQLFEGFRENGVDYVLNCGADMESSKKGIAYAEQYEFVYAAVGVHPHEAEQMTDDDLDTLAAYARNPKVVAIGEIGLDYHYDLSPREIQRKRFCEQLQLSAKVHKPVIIHSRDAAQECFDLIKESGIRRGVVHSYSGSVEMAQEYIKMGYYIGIGGILTFDKTRRLLEVVKHIPIEKILIETDSPYLAPVPNRGQRNDSHNLKYIAAEIGHIKQISTEMVAQITSQNAKALFDII